MSSSGKTQFDLLQNTTFLQNFLLQQEKTNKKKKSIKDPTN